MEKLIKEFYEIFIQIMLLKVQIVPLEGAKRGKDTSMWLAIEKC
jgi:hypothetical protein